MPYKKWSHNYYGRKGYYQRAQACLILVREKVRVVRECPNDYKRSYEL